MSGTEDTYNTNTNRIDTRETTDDSDMAKAKPKTYVDPKLAGPVSQGVGAPDRKDFDAGLPGDAAYAKAVRRYQKLKTDGQSKALGDMKTPGGD